MSRVIYPSLQAPVYAQSQPEPVTESRWHQPYSEPVRHKTSPRLAVALASSFTLAFYPLPLPNLNPANVAIAQTIALSEPVRVKPRLVTGAQRADFLVKATPFGETITADKWFRQLDKPSVLEKRGLRPDGQQSLAWLQPGNLPETTTYDRYAFQWSEPVRVKPRLREANQQVLAWLQPGDLPELPIYSKWSYAWSEPVRVKARLREASQAALAWTSPGNRPETVTYDRWSYPYSEPVRLKKGLGAPLQLATVWAKAEPFPEPPSYDKWSYLWSEPVRQKKGLGAPYQLASVIQLSPPTSGNPDRMLKNEIVRARMLGPGEASAAAYSPPVEPDHLFWDEDVSGGGIAVSSEGRNAQWVSGFQTNIRSAGGKSTGKWYVEFLLSRSTIDILAVGLAGAPLTELPGFNNQTWALVVGERAYHNSVQIFFPGQPTWAPGDIVSFALDMDNGRLWFGVNGLWLQGNPGTGASPVYSSLTGPLYLFADASYLNNEPAVWISPSAAFPIPTGFSYWV